jgi:hypothetical protein
MPHLYRHIHANGPRHIPSKANTPSSNCHRLASVIPRTKYASGSTQSRENKNRTSKKKRLKQQKCLLSIVPSHSHSIPDLLPVKFYTYGDGGNIGNPRINPPSSGTKPNQILSIRDFHLHVIRDYIPHPDKGLIYRFANKPSDIVLVPRAEALSHLRGSLTDSVSLCNALVKLRRESMPPKQEVFCLSLSYASSTTNIYVLVIKQIEQVLG